MREAFLSHSSRDFEAARKLRDFLVANGVPVWFSPHQIHGAQQWQDEIGEALDQCGWFLVLLTPAAVKSHWVKYEVQFAVGEPRYKNRIVPLLFGKCNFRSLSWVLPQIQLVDFTKDYSQGCRQLLRVLKTRKKGRS